MVEILCGNHWLEISSGMFSLPAGVTYYLGQSEIA